MLWMSLLHSKFVWSTFYVFQLHFVWIPKRSNHSRQPFRMYSDCICTAFEASFNWCTGVIWAQSNCSHVAFEVHSEHYDSILNILTVLQLHLSCIRDLIHLECTRIIRCRLAMAFFKKFLCMTFLPRCGSNFWKLFIPAGSVYIPFQCDCDPIQ